MRLKICAMLYWNSTISKDWPIFLKVITQAEFFIYLEHKSFFYTGKHIHNRENLINKAIKNSYSCNNYYNHTITTAYRNLRGYYYNRGTCRGCEIGNSHNGY